VNVLPRNRILLGDARERLSGLLAESVDCVITSPPYAGGIRNYGHVDQLGREGHVDHYVTSLAAVLRQVKRVLKPSGSVWLNLGDAYARHSRQGVAAKSLLLAPQRVALALAAEGWLVRNVCIWAKPNPLPQSARDRLTPTYEVIVFATKRRCYFFDLDAIRVPHRSAHRAGHSEAASRTYQGGNSGLAALKRSGRVGHPNGKNPGDVWTLATAVDRLGHQATFPEALIERPLLATCPERICVQCDTAWRRPVRILSMHTAEGIRPVRKVGELQRCSCFAPSRPGVVLDPFFGTGTVGTVAKRLERDWLGIELNPAYVNLANRRLGQAERRAA